MSSCEQMLGAFSSLAMAKRNGAQRHRGGDAVQVTQPIIDAIEALGSQMYAAEFLGVSSATVNKLINKTQRTLKRQVYNEVLKRLKLTESDDPVHRILVAIGHADADIRETIALLAEKLTERAR